MELLNHTPFPCLSFTAMDQADREYHVVVMRATVGMADDETLFYLDEQLPILLKDQHYGEANQSSVAYESDLAPFKPKCDVIVNGTAHAPGKKPSRCFEVGIRIFSPGKAPSPPRGLNPHMDPSLSEMADWEKEVSAMKADPGRFGHIHLEKHLMITGERHWERGLFGKYRLTRPEPVYRLPLRYENAYGGECIIEEEDPAARRVPPKHHLTPEQRKEHPAGEKNAPLAHRACETNPVGKGFLTPWYLKAKKEKHIPAPQIEAPHSELAWQKAYPPQGFGFIGRSWLPRRSLAGTYDETWLEKRHPLLPSDFDFRYWNGAPPDMQIPYLKGDERIDLFNLTPAGKLSFSLPGEVPYALVRYESGEIRIARAHLDTLIIEPDKRQVHMTYRATLPIHPLVRLLEARLIRKEKELPMADKPREVIHG